MSSTIISHLFRAIDQRDWAAFRELFDPEVVYERPGYPPLAGMDRLLRFYAEERIIVSGQHYIEQIVIDDQHGACWGRFVGVTKDGSPADELFTDVYTFAEGKIKARRSYFFRPAI